MLSFRGQPEKSQIIKKDERSENFHMNERVARELIRAFQHPDQRNDLSTKLNGFTHRAHACNQMKRILSTLLGVLPIDPPPVQDVCSPILMYPFRPHSPVIRHIGLLIEVGEPSAVVFDPHPRQGDQRRWKFSCMSVRRDWLGIWSVPHRHLPFYVTDQTFTKPNPKSEAGGMEPVLRRTELHHRAKCSERWPKRVILVQRDGQAGSMLGLLKTYSAVPDPVLSNRIRGIQTTLLGFRASALERKCLFSVTLSECHGR